jgi:hypothetical protein
MAGSITTAAMTIMAYPVVVTPVSRRRTIITEIGWAVVNRGWNIINRWRIDGALRRRPEARS